MSTNFVDFVTRWVDTLFAQLDANFRLKNKDRSLKDKSLNAGVGSIVEEEPYKEHLTSRGEQTEVCCTVTKDKQKLTGVPE